MVWRRHFGCRRGSHRYWANPCRTIDAYRATLEHFSRPRLALTRWETTPTLNVRVLNETGDLFWFFDATRQAEFLSGCIAETVRTILPRKIEYLRNHQLAKDRVQGFLEMPDRRFDPMLGRG